VIREGVAGYWLAVLRWVRWVREVRRAAVPDPRLDADAQADGWACLGCLVLLLALGVVVVLSGIWVLW
jgi:hypothetical protein